MGFLMPVFLVESTLYGLAYIPGHKLQLLETEWPCGLWTDGDLLSVW